MSITDIAMPEDLHDLQTEDSDKAHGYMSVPMSGPLDDKSQPASKRRKGKSTQETSDARRESHKLIEQKRRQKINEKINELRELLNYPDGSQNKAVVLQAAVDNIHYLKLACNKLLTHHRALQEEHAQVIQENERLRKIISEQKPGIEVSVHDDKLESAKSPALAKSLSGLSYPPTNFELSEVNFLYGTEAPNPIPFSPSLPSLSRGYVTGSSMIPSINSIQLTGSNTPYATGFTETREGIAPNTPNSAAANTATPTNSSSPLTSTETENGVSITRLLDYRL